MPRLSIGAYLAVTTLMVYAQAPVLRATDTAAEDFFEASVRPVLAERCVGCHGPEKQESDLRLDSRAAALRSGASGEPAVVPGQPEKSLLIQSVRRQGDFEMPPDEPLSESEVAAIVQWIKQGSPWPRGDAGTVALSLDQRAERDRASHWSLQPIPRPVLPRVEQDSWPRGPIDYFVLAKLESDRLRPSPPPADRRCLIRRTTYDLLGIPPTAAEVHDFVNDDRVDAYDRLVERLLASPRYGERWGRHWLDVARYADTRGYAFARERRYPYAYTYRDYVIHALNEDVPFDRFVLEQLAADQLELGENNRSLAALGFLTVGRRFNNRHDDIDDQIDVVTRGLLGLTVACARCHDHKYDAIPTEDYYSLYGVFASTHEPGDLPLIGEVVEVEEYREFLDELNRHQAALDSYSSERHEEFVDEARSHVTDYLVAVVQTGPLNLLEKSSFLSLSPEDLRPKLIARWRDYLKRFAKTDHPSLMPWSELTSLDENEFPQAARAKIESWRELPQINPLVREAFLKEPPDSITDVARLYGRLLEETYRLWKESGGNDKALQSLPDQRRQLAILLFDPAAPTAIEKKSIKEYLTREQREQYNSLQKQIDRHQVDAPEALPRAMVVRDNDNPSDAYVFIRGNHARRGDQVPRRFPAVAVGERAAFRHGSGRLELAQQIVNDENPLTARVIVNRAWMQHFGQPLVPTPSDFGVRCEEPVQVELLNYLAWRLRESNWSLKALHREIMSSATYRQASTDRVECRALDPENRLFWRMNRRRLEFEALRDSLLVASGQLDWTMGGKPAELFEKPFSRRRSVYGFIDRQDLPNLLRAFDFASPDQSSAMRSRTTVPQQALYFLNSPFVIEQAKILAGRPEVASDASTDDYVRGLYETLFARRPTPEELRVGVEFLDAAVAAQDSAELTPHEQYAHLLLQTNELIFVD